MPFGFDQIRAEMKRTAAKRRGTKPQGALPVSAKVSLKQVAAMGRGSDTMLAHINPAEARVLKAMGGKGTPNPRTGLPEFDNQFYTGGGEVQFDPNTGMAIPNLPTLELAGSTSGVTPALAQSYQGLYATGGTINLPAGTLPIDPSLLSASYAQTNAAPGTGAGGGITGSFFDPTTNPNAVAYPGNPYYTTDPATGYATFTPAGQAAYNAWYGLQVNQLQENIAGEKSGIGGILSNPLTGIPATLGFPLAVGGAVAGLGALGVGGAAPAVSDASAGLLTIGDTTGDVSLATDPSLAAAGGSVAGTTGADASAALIPGGVAAGADAADTAAGSSGLLSSIASVLGLNPSALLLGGLSGLGSIGSALISANAAKSAAGTQAAAANNATGAEQAIFNQTQQNIQPWIAGGSNALNALQQALGIVPGGTGGINATGFQGSPGYQFQLQQGTNAIINNASATGGIGGNTLKALQTYGTGLANQDWYNYLSQLYNLSGQGASAAGGLGGIASALATNIGNNITNAGNANAAGTVGTANAVTGGINSSLNNLLSLALLSNITGGNNAASSNPIA